MRLILTVLVIFVLLVASELWWRRQRPHDEFSRKFIHIFVGSLVAFTPLYLSWTQIVLLSLGFIGVVIVSKIFGIFQSIHAVERPTWGEVYFAAAVGILALLTHQPWIYAVALLHMSLADGLAAVVGVTWGGSSRYSVFGHQKSLAGSATFLLVSVALLSVYSQQVTTLSPLLILGIASVTTAIENIGVGGSDNLLVPVVVAAALIAVS